MIALAVAAAVIAAAGLARPRPTAGRRLRDLMPPSRTRPAAAQQSRSPARIAIAAAAVVLGVAVVGGMVGLGLGLVAALTTAGLPARQAPSRVAAADVPVVIDLVAGCLDAGTGMPAALDAAAVAAGEVLSGMCGAVAAALRSGVPPAEAWQPWLDDPWLAPVARTAIRTSASGAAAAEDFRRTANRLRSRQRAAAEQRVRSAAVWLVVPLGLCFLPAFVLVAVVPLVVGLLPSLR